MRPPRCIFIFIPLFVLIGCAPKQGGAGVKVAVKEGEKTLPLRALWRSVWGLADRYSTATADAYDRLEALAPTREAADVALSRKIGSSSGALNAVMDPNPLVGLMDLAVLATVYRMTSEDPWFEQMYQGKTAEFLQALRKEEKEIWKVAGEYLTPGQLDELRKAIDHWRASHPDQRYVSHLRITDLPEADLPRVRDVKTPSSVFSLLFIDPLASMDPAARELEATRATAERMFFYVQRMPGLLAGQTEVTLRRLLRSPEITALTGDAERFTQSTAKFADVSDRFTHVIDSLPDRLSRERNAAVNQIAAQVAAERQHAIEQTQRAVRQERQDAIREATTQFASERDQSIRQLQIAITEQRAALAREFEQASGRTVDRLYDRMLRVVLFASALAFVLMLISRLLKRRDTGTTADKSIDLAPSRKR